MQRNTISHLAISEALPVQMSGAIPARPISLPPLRILANSIAHEICRLIAKRVARVVCRVEFTSLHRVCDTSTLGGGGERGLWPQTASSDL